MQTLAGLHSSPVGRERYMEEMPKNYDPSTNEPAILQKWLDGGYYKRREGVGDCTVTIPPPNVTGKLHMGHATDDSIQDAIIRMARMRGRSTRWVLGTDHAGIATQTKVDKKLKSEGISRLEIGRDKFVDACWDWTHEYGGIIVEQIKRMGCSVDFDNERFTMDEDYAQAVRKVFCDWYHDGLIYRGKRIVNWCPLGRRGRVQGREGSPVAPALPADRAGQRPGLHRRRHYAPRDHARRHGRGRLPEGPREGRLCG